MSSGSRRTVTFCLRQPGEHSLGVTDVDVHFKARPAARRKSVPIGGPLLVRDRELARAVSRKANVSWLTLRREPDVATKTQ